MTHEALQERRSASRQSVTQSLEVTGEGGLKGMLVNLSHGGFMLVSPRPIEEKQLLRLLLELPGEIHGSRSIRFEARCVWCQPSSFSNEYGAGFQIEHIATDDRRRVEVFFGSL